MQMKKNTPDLWRDKLPVPQTDGHKYNRGHAMVYGAPEMTGATRLAASACARIGAGLTSVISTQDSYNIYRVSLPAHVIVRNDLSWWDDHVSARLYGSGGLPCAVDFTKDIPTVDADALAQLPDRLSDQFILTPHEGEFARAFPDITGERAERAVKAAEQMGCVVVLKGAQSVIAAPNGDIIINKNASPYLASAGTGDVLAGMIAGLCAAGMAPFDAACAAVWMHGEAGKRIGEGLVASDIEGALPDILHGVMSPI